MPLIADIQTATEEGLAISVLYARLRATPNAGERADLLREVGEYADALGRRLRRLTEQQAQSDPDEQVRKALARLSTAMEQVMVQEREYRMACGAPDDPEPSPHAPQVP